VLAVYKPDQSSDHKVVLDDTGHSKGFGFIRFSNETEQQTALTSMMGVSGLGGKPLKVSLAVQKTKHSEPEMEIPQHLVQHVASQVIGGHSQGPPSYQPPAPDQAEQGYNAEYYQQYSQYWQQYAQWQQWQQQYAAWDQHQQAVNGGPHPPAPPTPADKMKADDPHDMFVGPLNQLVEHTRTLEQETEKWLEESEELWESIDESRWWQPPV